MDSQSDIYKVPSVLMVIGESHGNFIGTKLYTYRSVFLPLSHHVTYISILILLKLTHSNSSPTVCILFSQTSSVAVAKYTLVENSMGICMTGVYLETIGNQSINILLLENVDNILRMLLCCISKQ